MTEEIICDICGESEEGFGHNAEPVYDGRCCTYCNENVVIPTRINITLEARRKNNALTEIEGTKYIGTPPEGD